MKNILTSIKNFLKEKWFYKLAIALMAVAIGVLLYTNQLQRRTNGNIDEIEYIDSLKNYHKVFYDKKFSALKKENKELYDSLKKYKDKVDFLIQFKYEKEYSTGIVKIVHDTVSIERTGDSFAQTFEYQSEPNDTFSYNLKINSEAEPNWYSLDVRTKEQFTIVNKKNDGSDLNEFSLETDGHGTISDVTVFSKKRKTKVWDRFSVGPTVGVGYDPINNKIGATIGVGITYDLRKRK